MLITFDERVGNRSRLVELKSIAMAVVWLWFIAIAGAACMGETESPPEAPGRIRVVASIAPLADFVQQVGGDHVQVITLVPPGASPHTYELTPAQVEQVARAKVLVLNGVKLEYWADKLVQSAGNPNLIVVDTSRGIGIMAGETAGAGGNPHIWLDPRNAIVQVEHIRAALLRVDPAHADNYRANAKRYSAELWDLDQEIANEVATWSNRQQNSRGIPTGSRTCRVRPWAYCSTQLVDNPSRAQ